MLSRMLKLLDVDSETAQDLTRVFLEKVTLPQPPIGENSQKWQIEGSGGFAILAKWYYLAIMEFLSTKLYDGSSGSIASNLGLSNYSVETALRQMLAQGLLVEKDGRLRKSKRYLRLASAHSKQEVRAFHKQMLAKATEELDKAHEHDFQRRLIFGITVTADAAKLAEAKKMLSDSLHQIAAYLSESQGEEVYHLSAQLFPLSRK